MHHIIWYALMVIPLFSWGQRDMYIGINVAPILVNTLDLRFEYPTSSFMALEGGLGFRVQGREIGETPRIAPLKDYIQPRNRAAFFSFGARVFTPQSGNYPYISLNFSMIRYSEDIWPRNATPRQPISVEDNIWASTLTIGFVSSLAPRWDLDVGIQFGYSPPREDLLAYYYPGAGYTSFGFGKWGVEGGHFQPVVTFKYNLVKNRRYRILNTP